MPKVAYIIHSRLRLYVSREVATTNYEQVSRQLVYPCDVSLTHVGQVIFMPTVELAGRRHRLRALRTRHGEFNSIAVPKLPQTRLIT